ncbi:MAG: crotonase/enoyl-CoA hydratase family protein [Spirochaetaceae bacterium]|nr:crotonase/enoyl-CoA hydratase family protein [Myxococcales bacterium]MCB9726293.1 crotonase/enoyl-CoA hydratase family protein [Spirochaetaceae bacterium]HPG25427.1 crotonase/enoyl-CoA hydratase family protein [Myxococcota bacterium]
MSDIVTCEVRDHVADVRLNRPDKMNAVNHEMWQALGGIGEVLAAESGVRAVVLSGNGRAFCSGLDMASFQAMSGGGPGAPGGQALDAGRDRPENFFQRAALVWKRIPVPVIAALHGVAYGAGAQIALGADIRFAAPDLRLSILEIKWGLIPDVGITQTLRNLVPLDVAKELTFTGRVLDAEAARALGLVTHVVEDAHAGAMALAREIAGKSPDAIRAGKRLLDEAWHADERTGLALEAALQRTLIGSPNQVESIRANFEKRAPDFADPD